ncbi:MAG TPA: hypothetical protein VK926_02370, partial [Gaiellaceae bacterium]|nr:hypothetical protein [Gaiellaceae bacterium]
MVGLLAGALAGAAVTGTAVAHRFVESAAAGSLEVSHLPPLLTADDETVELRYDAYCITDDEPEAPCDVEGTVFARAGDHGRFRELELRKDRNASEGTYVAVMPTAIARSAGGFSYYAVLSSEQAGARVTLPAAGPLAPQRSYRLERSVGVALGVHEFGHTQRAVSRPVEAAWGAGRNEVGLEQGRNLTPIGGSSF